MRRKWASLLVASAALLAFLVHERLQAARSQVAGCANAESGSNHTPAPTEKTALEGREANMLLLPDNHYHATTAAGADAALLPAIEITRSRQTVGGGSKQNSGEDCRRVQSIPRGTASTHHMLHAPPPGCRPFVAVVAPVTSRGSASSESVADGHFIRSLLRSAVTSLAHSPDDGYDVAFYVGYDVGDSLWDTDHSRSEVVVAAQQQVDRVHANDVHSNATDVGLYLKLVRCQGHSMVAASNCAISQAYDDGAEYWYRVNDDTLFLSPGWIQDFNDGLASFDPPNTGVVGPIDHVNGRILTYDYVHRTHWEIFGYHYPRFLKNWWCDDWITFVYGEALNKQAYSHLKLLPVRGADDRHINVRVPGPRRTARVTSVRVLHVAGDKRYQVTVSPRAVRSDSGKFFDIQSCALRGS